MKSELNRRALLRSIGIGAMIGATGGARAQTYPAKPVRIVHGYNSGTNPDTISRIIGPLLGERLGQPIVVEPKPGAAGRIATGYVAREAPDGHTLMMLTGGDTVTTAFDRNLTYNLLADYAFVATIIHIAMMITVSTESPLKSIKDLIEAGKSKAGGLTFGTPGVGTTQHLTGELLKATTGTNLVHVPYRESAFPDLIGGRLDFLIAAPAVTVPQLTSGKVRAIAVTSKARIAAARDVPAISETLTDFDVTSWLGLAVPVKTGAAVVDRLVAELRYVLNDQATRTRLIATGSEVGGLFGDDFRARVEGDVRKWKTLVGLVRIDG